MKEIHKKIQSMKLDLGLGIVEDPAGLQVWDQIWSHVGIPLLDESRDKELS